MQQHRGILRLGVAAIVTLVVLGIVQTERAAAAGVAARPDSIAFDDVLRTTEYVKQVTILHDFESDAEWEFRITGDVEGWITLTLLPDRDVAVTSHIAKPDELTPIGVKLRVPEDVANGSYKGAVEVIARPIDAAELEETGSGVGGVGAVIPITVFVSGDQNIEGALIDVTASDAEEGIPMRFTAEVRNLGNVAITPIVTTEVLFGAAEVATITANDVEVPPGEIRTIRGQWDTTNADIGTYLARINVLFGGIDLGTEELSFTVSPRGSLTRSARIVGIALRGEVRLGGVAQVDVNVRNTGRIEGRAVFQGAILRDDQLLEVVESLPRLILPDEVGTISIFVEVPEPGVYTVQGRINFDGKDTEEETFSFEVTDPFVVPVEAPPDDFPVVPVSVVAAALGAMLVTLLWRRRKRSSAVPLEPPERQVREHESVS